MALATSGSSYELFHRPYISQEAPHRATRLFCNEYFSRSSSTATYCTRLCLMRGWQIDALAAYVDPWTPE